MKPYISGNIARSEAIRAERIFGCCIRCNGSRHIPVLYPCHDGETWEWEACPDCRGTGTSVEEKPKEGEDEL